MTPARQDTIATLRASANAAGASGGAGLHHLADLLTHHASGFPNVLEGRPTRLRTMLVTTPRRLGSIGCALGR